MRQFCLFGCNSYCSLFVNTQTELCVLFLYSGFTLKVKVARRPPIRLPSVGLWSRSWSRFLAVSLQVTWVINLAVVSCHFFPLGLQLPPQPLRGLLSILLLGKQRHNGCETVCRRLLPSVQDFNRHDASRGPSAIAEHLVRKYYNFLLTIHVYVLCHFQRIFSQKSPLLHPSS